MLPSGYAQYWGDYCVHRLQPVSITFVHFICSAQMQLKPRCLVECASISFHFNQISVYYVLYTWCLCLDFYFRGSDLAKLNELSRPLSLPHRRWNPDTFSFYWLHPRHHIKQGANALKGHMHTVMGCNLMPSQSKQEQRREWLITRWPSVSVAHLRRHQEHLCFYHLEQTQVTRPWSLATPGCTARAWQSRAHKPPPHPHPISPITILDLSSSASSTSLLSVPVLQALTAFPYFSLQCCLSQSFLLSSISCTSCTPHAPPPPLLLVPHVASRASVTGLNRLDRLKPTPPLCILACLGYIR